ncbi:S1C family serine protease [Candidatus Thiothrix anitrata]|uniref:Trypsin-like peptidase domain-containing protein n=1 Tax=Candidatus Thiothrix anitrata TaxID=2823902 RepID=A0ABX7X7S3_9GAMM|nr:S1C family serine protease [Candidatus Thiothrix anitrata]QTR51448.1 trypsin-like peptidase domain-containing protein [Candidatus Thiothrix anitrata]
MRHAIILSTALACLGVSTSHQLLAEIGLAPAIHATTQPATPAGEPPAQPNAPATNPAANAAPAPATTTALQPMDVTQDGNDPREKIKNAVVKIHVVQHVHNTLSPWNSDSRQGSGSGLLIEGNLILTNAHVIANATFLEVQRHGETKRYEAEVIYVSHESDLALVRPKAVDTYKDIPALELGDLPKMQQQVEVYGFPIGGNTLSVTRGVVSRIEKQNYVHTGENLIAVQVDAAINFGNSGGPVISDGKVVGVAMQSNFLTENIGYMIPIPIIRHVLNDVKDGKVDGYGFHGFLTQSLENPSMRRRYGLQDQQTGILVHKIYKKSPADGKIQIGDIVTEIDGHKLENNGTVEFRPGEFIDHTHYIDMHQIGENITFKIIRQGQTQDVSLLLDKPGREYLLVKPNQYDKQPSYFIFGGFVFVPLNQDVIDAMEGTPARIGALTYEAPDEQRKEAVILSQVLPADINKDHHRDSRILIEKMDSVTIQSFRDLFERIQASTADFITLEGADDYQIVIDRKEALARQPDILKQYGISADRSKDLQAPAGSTVNTTTAVTPAAVTPTLTTAPTTPPVAAKPEAAPTPAVVVTPPPSPATPPAATAPTAPTPMPPSTPPAR